MSNKMTLNFKMVNQFVNPLEPTSKDSFDFGKVLQLLDGVGQGNAETIWHDERTLSASSSEDLDLNGVLIGAFGVAKAFTKIKGVMVFADANNTNDVLVGDSATFQFLLFGVATGVVTLTPGGMLWIFNPSSGGIAVSAGTTDLLKIENSAGGTSVTYTIAVLGEIT